MRGDWTGIDRLFSAGGVMVLGVRSYQIKAAGSSAESYHRYPERGHGRGCAPFRFSDAKRGDSLDLVTFI